LRLFVGDDWAEDHHDVELMDAGGRRLAKARLPEGVAGIARLHAMVGGQLGEDADEEDAGQVAVGIETDRGPWVQALIAAGYEVFAIIPMSVARYRERHSTSGAKSDAGDAHVLAEIVRLDRGHHRPVVVCLDGVAYWSVTCRRGGTSSRRDAGTRALGRSRPRRGPNRGESRGRRIAVRLPRRGGLRPAHR
jgi:hypothetical protein